MNTKPNSPEYQESSQRTIWLMFRDALVVFGLLMIMILGLVTLLTPFGDWLTSSLSWLFATDSQQLWWYITRSAGIIAYLLLWLSTVWGLAVPSRIVSPVLEQGYTFDFHQFISLLSIGFTLFHILVLTLDRYLPYSTLQILIPFLSPYRPLWVGIGVISFYLILLVTITFYLRTKIGMSKFKAIHLLSLVGYLGATLHGLYSGTDSPLLSMQLVYRGTGLIVIFLTIYWLIMKVQNNQKKVQNAATESRLSPVQANRKIR
jgi:predicted ferric reductase